MRLSPERGATGRRNWRQSAMCRFASPTSATLRRSKCRIVENLQRRDVHPLEEAQGFAALLRLEEPTYSIEQIAAKCGKQPGYVASRIRLTELAPAVVEAFAKDEIGVGHALLLAKLQPEQQEEALAACWQESYGNGSKSKRILLPVRHLREWIEHNILLELAAAPFSKDDSAACARGRFLP